MNNFMGRMHATSKTFIVVACMLLGINGAAAQHKNETTKPYSWSPFSFAEFAPYESETYSRNKDGIKSEVHGRKKFCEVMGSGGNGLNFFCFFDTDESCQADRQKRAGFTEWLFPNCHFDPRTIGDFLQKNTLKGVR